MGDKDEAFRLLQKAYEQHSAAILYLGADPFWEGVRSDPRYSDLMRRIGLPQSDDYLRFLPVISISETGMTIVERMFDTI